MQIEELKMELMEIQAMLEQPKLNSALWLTLLNKKMEAVADKWLFNGLTCNVRHSKTNYVFGLVGRERCRQEELKAQGKFQFTCADVEPAMPNIRKACVLCEEVGEVVRAVNEMDNVGSQGYALAHLDIEVASNQLISELIQVAAAAGA